ncbi:YegS/Rv2252/BmrU family lipid kinase [soil metagenome]
MKSPQSKHEKILVIVNPVSGKGDVTELKKIIFRAAQKYSDSIMVEETTVQKSAFSIAEKEIKSGVKRVIVCGGDGTVMEVVGAAVKKNVILGVVPLGTGNLFAKNLHIPTELKAALTTAFEGKVIKIDVGKANNTYFTIIAGVGLDADVMSKTDHNLKNKFGIAAYIASGIKSLNKSSGRYRIRIDGKKLDHIKAKSIMIANMGKITGGIKAVPGADPKSGTLKIGIIQASHVTSWVSLLFNSIRGNINKSSYYKLYEGQEVVIESLGKPQRYECDGEDFPPTKKLDIQILHAALSVTV